MTAVAAGIVTATFLEPPRAGKSLKDLTEGAGGSLDGPPAPPDRQEEARGGMAEDSNPEEEDRLEAKAEGNALILTYNSSFELFAALGQK